MFLFFLMSKWATKGIVVDAPLAPTQPLETERLVILLELQSPQRNRTTSPKDRPIIGNTARIAIAESARQMAERLAWAIHSYLPREFFRGGTIALLRCFNCSAKEDRQQVRQQHS